MWLEFLFARKCICTKCICILFPILSCFVPRMACAMDGRASFATLLAGGLSPVGLGGFSSSPARYADPSYGVSYYWLDGVEESSWNLSLDFGNDVYRM